MALYGSKLEEIWRLRLDHAAERHREASINFRKALEEIKRGVPPDGSCALKKARLEESAARAEHIRLLRIFTDLILYGKVPKDHVDSAKSAKVR